MTNKKFNLITKIVASVLALGSIIFFVAILTKDVNEFKGIAPFNAESAASLQASIISPFFLIAYIALGLCVIFAVGFPIVKMIMNPKEAIRIFAIIGILGFVVLVSYLLAPAEMISAEFVKKFDVVSSTSKWVSTGIITTYILLFGAVAAWIYTEVVKIIKG